MTAAATTATIDNIPLNPIVIAAVAIPAARGVPVFIPISVKGQFIRFRIENTNASQDFAVDAFAVLVRELTIARERVA